MSEQGKSGSQATVIAAGTVMGLGCLSSPLIIGGGLVVIIIIGGLGVLLAPLVALILLFGGGGSKAEQQSTGDEVIVAFEGDGQGTLDETQIPGEPAELVEQINKAGKECDAISPVIIAAQIEAESNFDPKKVTPEAEGISGIPKAAFVTFGKDDDDNDKTSALDTEDSIMAQARYLCDLYPKAKGLVDSGKAIGDPLDLTLVAYRMGFEAVENAGGVPDTNEARGYPTQVRVFFAKYQGIGSPPERTYFPSDLPTATTTPTR